MDQRELGGVLDGDQALARRNEIGQHIEQRRLARAGAARDDQIAPQHDALAQKAHHALIGRAEPNQVVGPQPLAPESPDGDGRSLDRQRRDHRVHPRAVGQARIDHRRAFIDAPADGRHDALDHRAHRGLAAEGERGGFQTPGTLDEDLAGAVDHDLAHRTVGHQAFQWPEANHLIQSVGHQPLGIDGRGQRGLALQDLLEQRAGIDPQLLGRELTHVLASQVDRLQQPLVQQHAPGARRFALGRSGVGRGRVERGKVGRWRQRKDGVRWRCVRYRLCAHRRRTDRALNDWYPDNDLGRYASIGWRHPRHFGGARQAAVERVLGGHRASHHPQTKSADHDLVDRLERAELHDALAVDPGARQGPRIHQTAAARHAMDLGVHAGHPPAVEHNLVVLAATDPARQARHDDATRGQAIGFDGENDHRLTPRIGHARGPTRHARERWPPAGGRSAHRRRHRAPAARSHRPRSAA